MENTYLCSKNLFLYINEETLALSHLSRLLFSFLCAQPNKVVAFRTCVTFCFVSTIWLFLSASRAKLVMLDTAVVTAINVS